MIRSNKDFQNFVIRLNEMDYGVNFNTYREKGIPMCYIMVSQKGDSGTFVKRECVQFKLNETLDNMFFELKKIKQ